MEISIFDIRLKFLYLDKKKKFSRRMRTSEREREEIINIYKRSHNFSFFPLLHTQFLTFISAFHFSFSSLFHSLTFFASSSYVRWKIFIFTQILIREILLACEMLLLQLLKSVWISRIFYYFIIFLSVLQLQQQKKILLIKI